MFELLLLLLLMIVKVSPSFTSSAMGSCGRMKAVFLQGDPTKHDLGFSLLVILSSGHHHSVAPSHLGIVVEGWAEAAMGILE